MEQEQARVESANVGRNRQDTGASDVSNVGDLPGARPAMSSRPETPDAPAGGRRSSAAGRVSTASATRGRRSTIRMFEDLSGALQRHSEGSK